ncbi:putative S-adenosyl-L-methionine-dependent methyltransferase [Seiridium unicorne]|uniref:S-adenosyl-L-methionine-dependent methyltransferase n=1 Tax=Seiridium unicorne TaxID=138068 RepID=A0ABR2V605_9PEZI
MSPSRSLSELAALIQTRSASIEDALKSAGLPPPSFAVGSPLALPLSPELEDTRDELVEALDELRALVLGPMGHLLMLMLPLPALNATFHALYHFRIPQNLGLQESVSYAVLAERCGLPEDDLRRFVRMAMTVRMFDEDAATGHVRHTAASSVPAALPPAADFLGMLTEEMGPASVKMVEATQRFPASQEPSDSAASVAMGTEGTKDFYAAIAGDAERVRRVASGMSLATKLPSHAAAHFVDHCGWAAEGKCPRKIVDIGGSEGELCKALLRRYAGIEEAVSLDRAEVVEARAVPEDLEGRLRFGAYDFLEQVQRVEGADVYMFRNCFHNWPDRYAVRMLRNQIPVLRKGARVFVNETCMPEPHEVGLVKGQVAWGSDLIMKMTFNGKDRSRQDWINLFKEADERFNVVSIATPPRSALAVIEVVWEG